MLCVLGSPYFIKLPVGTYTSTHHTRYGLIVSMEIILHYQFRIISFSIKI
jgi:hypothetical protein